jgi:hypothetical protein
MSPVDQQNRSVGLLKGNSPPLRAPAARRPLAVVIECPVHALVDRRVVAKPEGRRDGGSRTRTASWYEPEPGTARIAAMA